MSQPKKPLVSIVIPTYFRVDKLKECLETIVKYTDLEMCEVIVVANGAPEETCTVVELYQGYPIYLLWYNEPLGYPKACNAGIKAAEGEFIVLFNDDCLLLAQDRNRWIDVLMKPFLADERVGISGPQRLYDENSKHHFIIFFCVMLRRACLDDINLLDESTGIGFGEDTIACIEAERKGWRVVQVPNDEHENILAKLDPDTTLEGWKHDRIWYGDFPLFHDAESTLGNMPESEGILRKNRMMLRERYATKPSCTEPREGERCEHGLALWRAGAIDGWFGLDEGHQLAEWVRALPAGSKVCEIGSWHGRSSRFIADNLSDDSQLWCVDTWIGSSGEPEMHGTAHYDRGDHAHQWWWCNLQEHIAAGRVVPVRMHSDNAAHTIGHLIEKGQMSKFDLIFIDGDHSEEGIKNDIESWLPLLKEGGLICGHDYYRENEGPYWVHVRQYVEKKFPNVQKAATSLWYTRPHKKIPARQELEAPLNMPSGYEVADPSASLSRHRSSYAPRGHVYDCFIFNNELDLLEVRLRTLNDVVDRFVLVEGTKTHSGHAKELTFDLNKERFAEWLPKITHVVVDDYPDMDFADQSLNGRAARAWTRERHQRDAILQGLRNCADNDIIILGDADEIASPEAIRDYKLSDGLVRLKQRLFYCYMNCENPAGWDWQKIASYETVRKLTPCGVRYPPAGHTPLVENGGWHFSFCGGPDAWIQKLETTAHVEFNEPQYKDRAVMTQRVLAGDDLLGRDGLKYQFVQVDDTYPPFIRDNIDRFIANQFIYQEPSHMHPEADQFIASVRNQFSDFFIGKKVLEVGSLDINGSVRRFFSDCDYEGIDIAEGRGVDRVVLAHNFIRDETYDVVISSEMLEHDQFWPSSLKQMYANLKPGGLMIVTCAGPNRPEHGTARTNDSYSSPFTAESNYYRNISIEDFRDTLPPELWADAEISYARGGEDLYFRGIKAIDTSESALLTEAVNAEVIDSRAWLGSQGKKHYTVTAMVSTKDRYQTTLPLTLSSIINQTRPPEKLKIYDDSDNRVSAEQFSRLSPFSGLLKLAADRNIQWEIIETPRKGQVLNHQHCLDSADTDMIWRVDDDEIPEPNCLQTLLNTIRDFGRGGEFDKIAAVGGLVHNPGAVSPLPNNLDGSIRDIGLGLNLAWFNWNGGVKECEHLYSTFLYRVAFGREVGGYPADLSPIGHREESWFTNKLYRAGYKVLLTPHTVTHHLREASGGLRSYSDNSLWEHDEAKWQEYLRAADQVIPDSKLAILDCGLGDHLIFKAIFNELQRLNPRRWVLAVCYPEVFAGLDDVTIISIADAKLLVGNKFDDYLVYAWMWKHDWKGNLADAMKEFYK